MSLLPQKSPLFQSLGIAARDFVQQLINIINGNLTVEEHINLHRITTLFGAANTDNTIDISSFKLNYVPANFIVSSIDGGGIVYAASKAAWTANQIVLRCTQAGDTVNLVIF